MPKSDPLRAIDSAYIGLGGSKIEGSGISQGTGGGITIHSQLTGRSASDAHPIAAITELQNELDKLMRWRGEWSAAITYDINDVVIDGDWTMVSTANDNDDRAAPQPLRAPTWTFPDGLPWTGYNTLTSTLYTAQRYTVTQSGWASAYRVYIPANGTGPEHLYQPFSIHDSGTGPIYTFGPQFTANNAGWFTVNLENEILVAGEVIDFVLSVRDTVGQSVFAHAWDYRRPNNQTAPSSGQITHANRALNLLLVHKTDDNGTDRSASLATVNPGDSITAAGLTWTVISVVDSGSYMTFEIDPMVQIATGVHTFTFEVYGDQPLSYVRIDNYWQTNTLDWATVQGYLQTAGGTTIYDDHAYGFDIEFAPALVSDKWDFLAYSSASGVTSPGGGGGTDHDPVTSPLGSITIGGDSGQEIDVNAAYPFAWTGNQTWAGLTDFNSDTTHSGKVTFDNPSYRQHIVLDRGFTNLFHITLDSGGGGDDWISFETGAGSRIMDVHASDGVRMRDDLSVDNALDVTGLTTLSGNLKTGTIYGLTNDLRLAPAGNLELYPGTYPADSVLMDGIQKYHLFDGGDPGVFIDWTGNLGSKFQSLEVEDLLVQQFTVKSAEVRVGQQIVGKSASTLTRPFTIPAEGQNGTIYIKNVPGVDDMSAFAPGDDLTFRYWCETGGGAPQLARLEGHWAERAEESGSEGYGPTIISEDFEAVSIGQPPPNNTWLCTGSNNSMVENQDVWEGYDNTNIHPDRMLKSAAAVGDDANYHMHYVGSGYGTLSNYEYAGMFRKSAYATGIGITLLSDYPNTDTYVRIRTYNDLTLHVAPHGYTAPNQGITDSGFAPAIGQWVQFRAQIEDDGNNRTTLRARFWNDGAIEPNNWQIDCYWEGANRPQEGTFGIWGYQTASSSYATYDNLLIRELGSTYQAPSVTLDIPITSETTAVALFVLQVWDPPGAAPILTVPPGFAHEKSLASLWTTYEGHYNNLRIYEKSSGFTPGTESWTVSATSDGFTAWFVTWKGTRNPPLSYSGNNHLGTSWTDEDVFGYDTVLEYSVQIQIGPDSGVAVQNATYAASTAFKGEVFVKLYELPQRNKQQVVYTFSQGEQAGGTIHIGYNSNMGTGTFAQYGLGYAKVVQRQTPGDLETDEQAWEVQITRGPSGSCVLESDATLFDLGVSGDSFWIADAIDPLSGGAYDAVIQRGDNPWDWTSKIRTGYLGGTKAQGTLGFYFREQSSLVELSETRAYFENVSMRWSNGGNDIGYINENLGFGAYASLLDLDIDPKGFALLSNNNSAVLGGLFGYDDTATDTAIVRLESEYEFGFDNTRIELISSAGNGNKAETYAEAARGPYWSKDQIAYSHMYVESTDLVRSQIGVLDDSGNVAYLAAQIDTSSNAYIFMNADNIQIDSIINYTDSMGTSSKNPATDPPNDWVECQINGTTYYIPAYTA